MQAISRRGPPQQPPPPKVSFGSQPRPGHFWPRQSSTHPWLSALGIRAKASPTYPLPVDQMCPPPMSPPGGCDLAQEDDSKEAGGGSLRNHFSSLLTSSVLKMPGRSPCPAQSAMLRMPGERRTHNNLTTNGGFGCWFSQDPRSSTTTLRKRMHKIVFGCFHVFATRVPLHQAWVQGLLFLSL